MARNIHQAQSHDILRSWQSERHDINHHKDFVLPMFIGNSDDSVEPIESMPGVYRFGCNKAMDYLEPLVFSYGLRAVLLFPVMTKSDQTRFKTSETSSHGDIEDNSEGEILSSSEQSSNEQYSPHSTSSISSDDDNGDSPSRLPEPPKVATSGGGTSQNPFLSQSEEEKEHLLGDRGELPQADPILSKVVSPKTSKSHDVRLIRGMALKDKHNPVLRLIPQLRAKFPKLLIICDVCLCAFTSTGHCCLFEDHDIAFSSLTSQSLYLNKSAPIGGRGLSHFPISNKITCQYLAMLSVEYALRGCDVVAPSDMMDGRIQTIREKLDEKKLNHVSILSYSAKFASSFYGPFRQATNNAPEFGDRRAYQLPPGSRGLALKAVQRDLSQGADIVMVKPALAYLDIVRDIKEKYPDVPVAVYQVSGEYSMLNLAAEAGIIDLRAGVNEVLTAYRRAGATIIISYFTPEILKGFLSNSDGSDLSVL